jgi:hypothetical protein
LDSLAVMADGSVCVATVEKGGIAHIDGDKIKGWLRLPDHLTTNICFGGDDMRTAWITCSGRLPLHGTVAHSRTEAQFLGSMIRLPVRRGRPRGKDLPYEMGRRGASQEGNDGRPPAISGQLILPIAMVREGSLSSS